VLNDCCSLTKTGGGSDSEEDVNVRNDDKNVKIWELGVMIILTDRKIVDRGSSDRRLLLKWRTPPSAFLPKQKGKTFKTIQKGKRKGGEERTNEDGKRPHTTGTEKPFGRPIPQNHIRQPQYASNSPPATSLHTLVILKLIDKLMV